MDSKPTSSLSAFPTELVNAVATVAARDADAVGLFLHEIGLSATPEQPRKLPVRFLLHLAAALRLLACETQGFCFHLAAGLPPARQALHDAFRTLHDPNANPSALCVSVLRLTLECFAWHGPRDLNADIALDDLSDEAALDVLAEFLWACRHLATPQGGLLTMTASASQRPSRGVVTFGETAAPVVLYEGRTGCRHGQGPTTRGDRRAYFP